MAMINYADKVALNSNSGIADINKVTADDMNQIKNAINNLFPVGFIIEVDNAEFNPNASWGGTWERLKGRVIVGVDEDDVDFNSSGQTGGEKEVTLDTEHIPVHNHRVKAGTNVTTATNGDSFIIGYGGTYGQDSKKYVGNAGGGQAHNNMQPYYTAYRWIKTAM